MPKTLIPPPAHDTSKAPIENVLELTSLKIIDKDLFTNTRPLWHPPGARGIYGGAAIAQSLAAAQLTIPPPSAENGFAKFYVHSMHCYFVLAGDADIPVIYSVERVREGRSFMTRTVQARQEGRCIFTTTLSFARAADPKHEQVRHEAQLPEGVVAGLDEILTAEESAAGDGGGEGSGKRDVEAVGPFEHRAIALTNASSKSPETKRTHQWVKARGKITAAAGQEAHLSALAYMSDSWFIGTVARVQNLWRFSAPRTSIKSTTARAPPRAPSHRPNDAESEHAKDMAKLEDEENKEAQGPPRTIGMMVSLDHSIYFHKPAAIKADEWLFQEMESPWAGDGRGLVIQKIWNRSGELLATCIQEGVVRLVQSANKSKL